ncbi:MAG: hypothetical protein ACRDV2_14090, partial [Actinomycetes bacterium]
MLLHVADEVEQRGRAAGNVLQRGETLADLDESADAGAHADGHPPDGKADVEDLLHVGERALLLVFDRRLQLDRFRDEVLDPAPGNVGVRHRHFQGLIGLLLPLACGDDRIAALFGRQLGPAGNTGPK